MASRKDAKKFAIISRFCFGHCGRVATIARHLTDDLWVALCEECEKKDVKCVIDKRTFELMEIVREDARKHLLIEQLKKKARAGK